MPMYQMAMTLAFLGALTAAVAAQAYAPVVTMRVTLPDGRTEEVTAPESELATVSLKDGTEYAFRPTILDDSPWNRIVVTIFRTATTASPTQIVGELEIRRAGPAVESRTNPSFKVAVPKVSPPSMQTSSRNE